jgi:YidC/Oxa1 family membrane protein insertase
VTQQPGQEQRTFLAILLAMGVLLVWNVLFPPPAPQPPAPGPQAGTSAGEPGPGPDALRGTAPGDTGAAPVAPGGESALLGVLRGSGPMLTRDESAETAAQQIRVQGEDVELVLDGRGARLVEARLLAFTEGDDHRPVQLIPDGGPGALGTVLQVGDREVSTDSFVYRLVSDTRTAEGRRIAWELALDQLTLRKTFVIPPSGHLLRVEQELVGEQVGLTGWGLSWAGGLRITEEMHGQRAPYFQASVFAEGKVQKKNPGQVKEGTAEYPGHTRFVAVHSKYFLGAIVPRGDDQGPAKVWRAGSGREEPSMGGEILVERTPGLAANAVGYDVYVGPLDYARLQATGLGIENTVDLGWSWVRPLSRGILGLLIWMHGLIPNYGVVIILFSLLINTLFFPLTYKSTKSMRDMAALKPRLDALKEKYKSEPQKMSEATMRLYKEAGVNPLAGCLPLLLQMPIFFALYAVLFHTIELRQAPFFGWIRDLSQPDVLFHLPFAIPFVGTGISLLPIIMGVTSFFQSKATMVDPNQKAMVYMMPVMMTFIFFTMPSGLVLYWLISNLYTIGQKAIMKPSPALATAEGAPEAAAAAVAPREKAPRKRWRQLAKK